MADSRSLRDYEHSRAVLIGTWNYDFLDPVPPVRNSMRRMVDLLTGPQCGWPADRILEVGDERGPGDLPDRLITAFADVRDVALFYYVGHGQIYGDNQLCLSLVGSRREYNRRASTSLKFADVREALQASPAATKIVILDCCFAGIATIPSLAGLPGDVLDMTAGIGAYTIAATSEYTAAWYEEGPTAGRPQTFFTKYLADLVERGIPGQPAGLRLDSLFRQLQENLGGDNRPLPRSRAVNDAGEFVFARNAARPETHRDLERENAFLLEWKTAAEAQMQALKAEAAERAQELERLQARASDPRDMTTKQQHELQSAISTAERLLDDSVAAEAAAKSTYPTFTRTPGEPAPAEQGRHRSPGSRDVTLPQLLGDRYELEGILARGHAAEVYRARDLRLDRTVAVKALRADRARDQTFQARFRREAQVTAMLNNPSIVASYDTGEDLSGGAPVPFTVMEYVDGRTVGDLLVEGHRLLPERTLEIVFGVLRALEYSHQAGIVHLDIKPRHVMVTRNGDIKVLDFGIARAISDTQVTVTQSGQVIGTASYMSPEHARGERVDGRSDLYSTGCLMYELLTGRPPFTGDSPVAIAYQHVRENPVPPSRLDPSLPPWADSIVLKAMAKSLGDRYQSAAEMQADIQRAADGMQVATAAGTAGQPDRDPWGDPRLGQRPNYTFDDPDRLSPVNVTRSWLSRISRKRDEY